MNGVEKPTYLKTPPPAEADSPPSEGWQNSHTFDGVVGKVFINETQYFENVPETTCNFYNGGYQPAQKWLKDRKGRTLDFEDMLHYQKMIYAMTHTERLMNEIDAIGVI